MELAQELFVTAVVAVLFSFVIAKLVSVAMSGNETFDEGKVGGARAPTVAVGRGGGGGGPLVEEVRFGEEKLRSPSVGSDRRVVEAVDEELRTVDRFGDELVAAEGEGVDVVEPSVCREDDGLEKGEAADEPSAITGLSEESPEEEVFGEAEVLADEAVERDVEGVDGNDGEAEASPEAKRLRDVEVRLPVVVAGEAADVVVEEEEEGKEEMEEEKEVVDEDGWEGIERSELEKDFAAAARFADDRKDRLEAAMGDDAKMQLYGLHKVATEGPCRDSPPMAVKVAARAKWYP